MNKELETNLKSDLFVIKQIDKQDSINFQAYTRGLDAAINFTDSLIKLHKHDKTEYRYEVYHMYETTDENGLPMFKTLKMYER